MYQGQVQYAGKLYVGEQAAIVDAAVWRQAQVALRKQPRREAGERKPIRKPSAGMVTSVVPEQAERVPRISRLMALAVRLEGLVREGCRTTRSWRGWEECRGRG